MAAITATVMAAAYKEIVIQFLLDTIWFLGSLGGLSITVLSPLPNPNASAGNTSVTIFKNKICNASRVEAGATKPNVVTINISLKLDLKGAFDFTYPEYKNGWDFVGHPDGGIEMNGKKYHYLFWDGKLNIDISKINFNEGFIVNKKNLVTFFESKLNQMGLKSNEIEDFITYWCPIMMANENNFVHFMFNDEYDYYAKLNVTPKPDAIFRVNMLWMKAANADDSNLKEQKLQSFTRSGFTIVEWGGAEIENSHPRGTL